MQRDGFFYIITVLGLSSTSSRRSSALGRLPRFLIPCSIRIPPCMAKNVKGTQKYLKHCSFFLGQIKRYFRMIKSSLYYHLTKYNRSMYPSGFHYAWPPILAAEVLFRTNATWIIFLGDGGGKLGIIQWCLRLLTLRLQDYWLGTGGGPINAAAVPLFAF